MFGEARRRVVLRVLSCLRTVNESRSTLLLRAGVCPVPASPGSGRQTGKRNLRVWLRSDTPCPNLRRLRGLVQAAPVFEVRAVGWAGTGELYAGAGYGVRESCPGTKRWRQDQGSKQEKSCGDFCASRASGFIGRLADCGGVTVAQDGGRSVQVFSI